MTKEYIEREKALELIRKEGVYLAQQYCNRRDPVVMAYGSCFGIIKSLPTADVEEVKHAHWIDDIQKVTTVAGVEFNGCVGYRCSLCGRREPSKEPYCNCGAKMDGGEDNVYKCC